MICDRVAMLCVCTFWVQNKPLIHCTTLSMLVLLKGIKPLDCRASLMQTVQICIVATLLLSIEGMRLHNSAQCESSKALHRCHPAPQLGYILDSPGQIKENFLLRG